MPKKLSKKYYQDNIERLQKKLAEDIEKKKKENVAS